ncbi:MAG: rhomboid family intramembrane serine protease [Chitinophagales bacterium]|nr:rhomboid family intramembrane serine protease [Chitinophagales bacterium]
MLFPIGDDQVKGGHFPLFSYAFIVLNILIFIQQIRYPDMLVGAFGSIPVQTLNGENLYTLITSMFLHGGLMHLVGNMLFLWVFADNIEATIGNGRFLMFYLLGGLAAHAGHIYYNPSSIVPTIGASGAISAVMGAYLIMFPTSRVKMWFFFFIFRIPAVLFLGFWIFMQWNSGTAALETIDANTGGTAWWAHIGGFAFGVIAGLYFRFQYPSRPEPAPTYNYYE